MVGGFLVGISLVMGLDVNSDDHGPAEFMAERMLDSVGDVVTSPNGQIRVDRDGGRYAKLVSVPSHSQIIDRFDILNFLDGRICGVDHIGFDAIQKSPENSTR